MFRKLYGLHFPIRHMQIDDFYVRPRDRAYDVTEGEAEPLPVVLRRFDLPGGPPPA